MAVRLPRPAAFTLEVTGNHTAGFATVTGLSQFDNVSAMLLLPLWSIRA